MGSKKDKTQNKAHEEGNTDHTAVDVSTPKMKSGKRKIDSELDSSLDASETYKENVETGSKKQKKESSSSLIENETTDFTLETIESQPAKKSKKDKKKKTASTLGVVDVDILQQAEVNFQAKLDDYNANCNDEEPVKKKKHSKKTKIVSFKEPIEATELPSEKKKHKTSKSQDLMSEETSDTNESEQSTKKRKHTEIEAQIVPSEELIEDNGNGTEQSTKKQKRKEKKAEEVSPEDVKENNESEQPTKKKKKKKEKMQTVTASKEGDDANRHERALQYLRLWQSSRNAWKFNKRMQVHLLHVMYDTSMMMDADFQILLLYLDGLKGKGREKTMEDARKILDNVDTKVNAGKEDRARQLYQMLA